MIAAVAQTLVGTLAGSVFVTHPDGIDSNSSPIWYDMSFIATRWAYTALGEQDSRSEALTQPQPDQFRVEEWLVSVQQRDGLLPLLNVATSGLREISVWWNALGVTLHQPWSVDCDYSFESAQRISKSFRRFH